MALGLESTLTGMSDDADERRAANENDPRRSRRGGTWRWRRRKRNLRTDRGQRERSGAERCRREVQDGPGPVIGVERNPAPVPVLVRMMMLGDRARTVSVVVPVIEAMDERKCVEG
jgi:hypothetical protein